MPTEKEDIPTFFFWPAKFLCKKWYYLDIRVAIDWLHKHAGISCSVFNQALILENLKLDLKQAEKCHNECYPDNLNLIHFVDVSPCRF